MEKYKDAVSGGGESMLVREGHAVYDLKGRTFFFARRTLEIAGMLPLNPVCNVLRVQLIKAGTSVGANVEEADGALTRPDFRNRMVIARKEAREAKYWLRLISGNYIIKEGLIAPDIQEISELVKIFSAISSKTKV